MAQKNISSKFNFFRDKYRKSSATEGGALFLSSHLLNSEPTDNKKIPMFLQKTGSEASSKQSAIMHSRANTSGIHQRGFGKLQLTNNSRRRIQSEIQYTEPKTPKSDSDKRSFRFLNGLEEEMPKLRETRSTQCQSPKANIKLMKQSKVAQFRKIKTLGKGRFGHVYLVKHKKSGFMGALKVINKKDLLCGTNEQNEKALAQLVRQIKIQSFLNHPNLIKLYDFFSDDDNVYLLLQLACDGPLYDWLQENRSFSQESTSVIIREVCEGVDHMHKREVIHRDIKLENIVLCHGLAKICDFGWSVHCPKEFRSTICGTPLYLSPQMLMGMQYTKKIDSWAIGALTHELFTSDNPFKIKHKDQLSKIITQDFQMQSGTPQLRSFITFILRKNPSKRPDADTILHHPFIEKYLDIQTSEELCAMSVVGRGSFK